jgi:Cu+-exporting ATPase
LPASAEEYHNQTAAAGVNHDGHGDHDTGLTRVYVAERKVSGLSVVGAILLRDQVKGDSASAVAALRKIGLRVLLITGDRAAAARQVAQAVGIDPADIHAEVPPSGKAAAIAKFQAAGECVAMVGDGINDAPALATADLGIAVGGGSDIAKEAGDIILVSGSLAGVAAAIALSRASMRKIRQNLFLAFIYNVIAIPLAAFGLLNPLIAAAAMALSDVSVLGNALRLRWERLE